MARVIFIYRLLKIDGFLLVQHPVGYLRHRFLPHIDWLYGVHCHFQQYFSSVMAASALIYALLTSTLHNILSKQLAAFPCNHCRNNGQWIFVTFYLIFVS